MPAIVVCAACQTKMKVPENSTAKALRCPKCKGIVPVAAKPNPAAEVEKYGMPAKAEANPPAREEEELEVNESVDEQEEELEVNEAAEEESEEDEEEDEEDDESSALVELGFGKGTDPFKKAEIPEDARKAIEKAFLKKEKALWAGKPVAKIIESKAWIGLVFGPILLLVGLLACGLSPLAYLVPVDNIIGKVLFNLFGLLIGTVLTVSGALTLVFRKRIGGNVKACYVVSNLRAYIYDGSHAVRAFTPEQLTKIKTEESDKFPGAGDLIFAYDFMGQGVMTNKESVDRFRDDGAGHSTAVGFLSIEELQLVKKMVNEILVEPALEKVKAKKKKLKEKKRYKPFG